MVPHNHSSDVPQSHLYLISAIFSREGPSNGRGSEFPSPGRRPSGLAGCLLTVNRPSGKNSPFIPHAPKSSGGRVNLGHPSLQAQEGASPHGCGRRRAGAPAQGSTTCRGSRGSLPHREMRPSREAAGQLPWKRGPEAGTRAGPGLRSRRGGAPQWTLCCASGWGGLQPRGRFCGRRWFL